MQQLTKEIEVIDSQVTSKTEIESQLKDVSAKEKAFAARSKTAKQRQGELANITQRVSALTISSDTISRAIKLFNRVESRVTEIISVSPVIERWPKEAGSVDRLAPIRKTFELGLESLVQAINSIQVATENASRLLREINAEKTPLENSAREIRKSIDNLQQGAGATSRAASQLREKLSQLQSLVALRDDNLQRIASIQQKRGDDLDKLDAIWEKRFSERDQVATRINAQLNPRIRVKPIRAAQLTQYANAVSAALRGSGLRYNELSASIASLISPRELVELIENGDSESLATVLNIQTDRASKLITHLREHGTAEILTSGVEDDVRLELLDGTEYKTLEHLSVGQRCTVVLPIVLEHKDQILIIDQPEDHLDNGFIVDSVLKAILNRGQDAQLILSTHNANLPVLGNAKQVIVMSSDGKRAFVEYQGELVDPTVVRAVTTIMEGGAEAFQRRAAFYQSHK